MEDKKPTYIEGLGWRYEVEHSMLRRIQGHDYSGRCIYMITLTTEGRLPLIVILENGFPPMYKPPGKYFEACAKGLLLMLAPWPYHTDRRTITRQQCLALNDMASQISTEPWTEILEHGMLSS